MLSQICFIKKLKGVMVGLHKVIRIFVLLAGLGSVYDARCNDSKPWTVLLYIAADNDLAEMVPLDIEELTRASTTANAHLLVYLNIREKNKKITQRIVVANGSAKIIKTVPGLDSGAPETLFDALAWAHKDFPSDRFACVLWDHGSGSLNRSMPATHRGVCYDDTTGNYLTDLNCQDAFAKVCKKFRNDKKIDIIAFDACLMADVEIAYALQPYADYMVASQELVSGLGYNYRLCFKDLSASVDSHTLAIHLVNAYKATYEGDDDYTLSALDFTAFTPYVDSLDRLSFVLGAALKNQKSSKVTKAIKAAVAQATHFDEKVYKDVVGLMNNIMARVEQMGLSTKEQAELKKALQDVIDAQATIIINNTYSPNYQSAMGLSIYFPDKAIEPSYKDLYWSARTAWLSFLKAYLKFF